MEIRKIALIITALLVLSFAVIIVNDSDKGVSRLKLTLNSEEIYLKADETRQLFAVIHHPDGYRENVTEVSTFYSSDSKVVETDENGVLIGKDEGTAIITVQNGRLSESVIIHVSGDLLQVNIREFGAYGDGSHDDTGAFKKAIAHLAAQGGGNLFIPSGTYKLYPIVLKPRVNLIGENRDSTILKLADDASDGQTRLIEMNDETRVQSLTCDGNYKKHPSGSEHMHCIFAYDKDNLLIENNRLMNAVGDGISISGSRKASNFVIIRDNIVEENQRSQIVIEQVNHLRVANNKISSRTGRPGIHFEPWEEQQFYDAKIHGNTITTNSKGYSGLLAGSGTEGDGDGKEYFYHDIEFYNNIVDAKNGRFLIEDTANIKVYGNRLTVREVYLWRKNQDASIYINEIFAKDGVYLEGGENGLLLSKNTRISDNSIRTTRHGIRIVGGSSGTSITNNMFTGENKGSGISLYASENIEKTMVSNNTFTGYKDGFETTSPGKHVVKGLSSIKNKFVDLRGYALFLTGNVRNVKMEQNEAVRTSGVYIWVDESVEMKDIFINDNRISGGKRGIFQDEGGKGSLSGLTILRNEISGTTASGKGPASGAAIELQRHSLSVSDVEISGNILRDNVVNKITVPKRLEKQVGTNKIIPDDLERKGE